MASERIVIRGGTLLTMEPGRDPDRGDTRQGEILVEGGKIAAVAERIDVGGGEALEMDARGLVVMPGFVDTHRHTWQTQMRGMCADWTLNDYFLGIRSTVSPAYTADDVRVGNYTGALEALNAGVTTLVDFSHCNNSPEHADAALAGLVDAKIRAVHCYGFFAPPSLDPVFRSHDERVEDFHRVVREHRSGDGLVTIGAALTEVGLVPWANTVSEIEVARELGTLMIAHTGCVWGSVMTLGVHEMNRHGLLGPDQIHVHCNTLEDDEWDLLARAGAKVSISPETELNMGMGRLAIGKCRELGIHPTLSCDIVSLNSGDLFSQMRLALAHQRFVDNDVLNRGRAMPTELTCRAREALSWATLYGAEACGLDSRIGSLTVGKEADIITIGGGFARRPRHDVAGSVLFQSTAGDVQDVLVGGRIVKRAGRLVGIDLDEVLDRAEESADRVLARVRRQTPALPPKPDGDFDFDAIAREHLAGAGDSHSA